MVNYQNGKIYRIVCNETGEQYIGSTCEPLCRRLAVHKAEMKRSDGTNRYISSFQILKRGSYSIILIENYPCEHKDELHRRERFYLESMECINCRKRPIINKDEIKEQKRLYYINNKDTILERQKEQKRLYYINNKDTILERQMLHNKKDETIERKKIYNASRYKKMKDTKMEQNKTSLDD